MANFEDFIHTVEEIEGGYQNRLDDPGNKNSLGVFVGTNFGISAPQLEKYLGFPPTKLDVKSITKELAKHIFEIDYWNKLKANYINSQAVAETFVDHGINAGPGTAAILMQKTLNEKFNRNLQVDGAIGPLSIEAINSVDAEKLFQEFSQKRIEDYKTKSNKKFWLKIWLKRVESFSHKFGIILKKKNL